MSEQTGAGHTGSGIAVSDSITVLFVIALAQIGSMWPHPIEWLTPLKVIASAALGGLWMIALARGRSRHQAMLGEGSDEYEKVLLATGQGLRSRRIGRDHSGRGNCAKLPHDRTGPSDSLRCFSDATSGDATFERSVRSGIAVTRCCWSVDMRPSLLLRVPSCGNPRQATTLWERAFRVGRPRWTITSLSTEQQSR